MGHAQGAELLVALVDPHLGDVAQAVLQALEDQRDALIPLVVGDRVERHPLDFGLIADVQGGRADVDVAGVQTVGKTVEVGLPIGRFEATQSHPDLLCAVFGTDPARSRTQAAALSG